MSLFKESEIIRNRVIAIAEEMLLAARTAPKGKGRDTIELMIAEGDTLEQIAIEMENIGKSQEGSIFTRDAQSIRKASALVLVGTRIESLGLNELCQLCGFENCTEKNKFPNIPCIFNVSDLNLAIGSAINIATNHCIDNRIMFTVGKAALNLNHFNADIKIAFGVPLAVSSKNPFFDRKT